MEIHGVFCVLAHSLIHPFIHCPCKSSFSGKQYRDKDHPYVQELFDALHGKASRRTCMRLTWTTFQGKINFPGPYAVDDFRDFRVHRIDFADLPGGDGTMLNAVTLVRDAGAPMLGINLGRMGFLNTIEKVHVTDAIQNFKRGSTSFTNARCSTSKATRLFSAMCLSPSLNKSMARC